MKRLAVLIVSLLAFTPAAHAYDDGDGGNGSGDGCYHGGCDTHHQHNGDTCISPCSITIIVPPVTNSPTTTTTRKENE